LLVHTAFEVCEFCVHVSSDGLKWCHRFGWLGNRLNCCDIALGPPDGGFLAGEDDRGVAFVGRALEFLVATFFGDANRGEILGMDDADCTSC